MDEAKTPIEKIIELLRLNKLGHTMIIFLIGCVLFNIIWITNFFSTKSGVGGVYFLNVGQGDSELVVFPSGVKLLIDGGPPNGKVEQEISRIIGSFDRYIDLVMLSHPQTDHFGGLVRLFDDYRVGAFLTNGDISEDSAYVSLVNSLEKQDSKDIIVSAGDVIRQGDVSFRILSPNIIDNKGTKKEDPNDRAIIGKLSMSGGNVLFTGDIGKNIENTLMSFLGQIDVLKVAHHGSKNSSSESFISLIQPKIAVIEVGKNSYGHPSSEVIQRLINGGASMFRTDVDGTIKVVFENGLARVSALPNM
ncbi:MAG: MBL fold metallo-hydrolase [Patescibacteria group bacterium]